MDLINTSETKRALEAVLEYIVESDAAVSLLFKQTIADAVRAMSAVPSYYHEDILRAVLGLNKPQEEETE